MRTITYPSVVSYIDENGKDIRFATSHYKIGLYLIINNEPSLQYNMEYSEYNKLIKSLKRKSKENIVSNLMMSHYITVEEQNNGQWIVID